MEFFIPFHSCLWLAQQGTWNIMYYKILCTTIVYYCVMLVIRNDFQITPQWRHYGVGSLNPVIYMSFNRCSDTHHQIVIRLVTTPNCYKLNKTYCIVQLNEPSGKFGYHSACLRTKVWMAAFKLIQMNCTNRVHFNQTKPSMNTPTKAMLKLWKVMFS